MKNKLYLKPILISLFYYFNIVNKNDRIMYFTLTDYEKDIKVINGNIYLMGYLVASIIDGDSIVFYSKEKKKEMKKYLSSAEIEIALKYNILD